MEHFKTWCDEPDVCSGFLPISQLSYNMYIPDVLLVRYVIYLAVFFSKPSSETNILNDEIALD